MHDLPVWDLDSLYKGFDDPRYTADQAALRRTARRLIKLLKLVPEERKKSLRFFRQAILLFDQASALGEQMDSYAYMVYSTDTRDEEATRQLGLNEQLKLPLTDASVRFRNLWSQSGLTTDDLIRKYPELEPYRLGLEEEFILAKHQMKRREENLAADLARSGGDAWGRLQAAVSSTLTAPWAWGKRKTVTELRALASHKSRKIREKAFHRELDAWKSVEIPLAAALNGVKGHSIAVNKRRGWRDTLEFSALQARLSEKALHALIEVLEDSLPSFRRYFKAKARLLRIPYFSFYDLFAPVGKGEKWSFPQARDFIVEQFGRFSTDMADFARMAFDKNWIHARPQEGKVGGAYCTSLPRSKEPRILANFDGSFGEVKTLAHELGHAWHFWLLKDQPHVYHEYPMTLAETASIFAETLIFEGAMQNAKPAQALFLLEQNLQDASQVIVDILSRFYFEKEVFHRRRKAELSPGEFCQIMADAQKKTYGETIEDLHPYMWAVKGHYYSPGLAFYNYPYAFGQLFSLALYNRFRQEGPAFVPAYQKLLGGTGIKTAQALAKEAGFHLETAGFWRSGINVLVKQIEDFERRVHEK